MDANSHTSDRVRGASAKRPVTRSRKSDSSSQDPAKDKRKRSEEESPSTGVGQAQEEKSKGDSAAPKSPKSKHSSGAASSTASAAAVESSATSSSTKKSKSARKEKAQSSPKAEKQSGKAKAQKRKKGSLKTYEEEAQEEAFNSHFVGPDSDEDSNFVEGKPSEKKARREAFEFPGMEDEEYISDGGSQHEDEEEGGFHDYMAGHHFWHDGHEEEDEEQEEEEDMGHHFHHQHPPPHQHPFGAFGGGRGGAEGGPPDPLQELLERLGSRYSSGHRGLFANLLGHHGAGGGGRYRHLLEQLRSPDLSEVEFALNELTQMLLMGNEETLQGFRPEQFVVVLRDLLSEERNPQIPIMACRALANMLEAFPTSSSAVASCASSLCEKLLCIEYIDLAEQCLTTLNKLSQEQGRAVLSAGGLSACLTFLDFFSLSLQRSALVTASNACKYACIEEFPRIQDAVPILSGLLDASRDKAMMESACLCLSRLVQGLAGHPDKLKLLCANHLLENSLRLLEAQPSVLSPNTFTMVLEYLVTICKQCPSVSINLLQENIGRGIRTMILGAQASSHPREGRQAAGSGLNLQLQPKQLRAVVRLAGQVLPPLPSDLAFSKLCQSIVPAAESGSVVWEWQGDDESWRPYSVQQSQSIEEARVAGQDVTLISDDVGNRWVIKLDRMEQVNPNSRNVRRIRRQERAASKPVKLDAAGCASDPRAVFFRINSDALRNLGRELLGVMFDAYLSAANPESRRAMVEWFVKFVFYSDPELLKEQLFDISISSYLAGMLSVDDPLVVMGALELVRLLIQKLPEIFHHHFRRQGVVHQILQLSRTASSGKGRAKADEAGAATSGTAGGDSSPPTSSRSGRPSSRSGKGKRATAAAAAAAAMLDEADGAMGRGSREAASSRSAGKMSADEISETLAQEARTLFEAHFGKVENGDSDTHEAYAILHSLRRLAQELDACWKPAEGPAGVVAMDTSGESKKSAGASGAAAASTEEDTRVLTKVFEFLADASMTPSSFEFLESGMLQALLNYLTVPSEGASTKRMKRIRAFSRVFIGDIQNEEMVLSGKGASVLSTLVANLHGSLNTVERFPTRETEASTNVGVELNTAIKLRLELDPGSRASLKEFGSPMVLIEPLASIQAIEDFLWPRVRMSAEERRAARAARAAAKAKAAKSKSRRSKSRPGASAVDMDLSGEKNEGAADEDEGDLPGEEEEEDEEEEEEDPRDAQQSRGERRGLEVHELHLPPAGPGEEIGSSDGLLIQTRRSSRNRLVISLDGHDLHSNTTIFQAIKMYSREQKKGEQQQQQQKGDIYTLQYRAYSDAASGSASGASAAASANASMLLDTTTNEESPADRQRSNQSFLFDGSVAAHPLEKYMLLPSTSKLPESDPTYPILCLLRALHGLNEQFCLLDESTLSGVTEVIPETHFANQMLSAKIMRQVSDFDAVCRGTFPAWCRQVMTACPFLVPLEQRLRYFYYTEVGPIRALQRFKAEHDSGNSNDGAAAAAQDRFKLSKSKVRVSRDRILESAIHVMKAFAGAKSQLEVEYFGEAGTGLGPTLEFYALASKAFQERRLGLWRETAKPSAADAAVTAAMESAEDGASSSGGQAVPAAPEAAAPVDDIYVYSPLGLFPAPLARGSELSASKRRLFETLGRFVAKAILDCRIVDLPFSSVFFAWLLGTEDQLGVSDLRAVDVSLWQTVSRLAVLSRRKAKLDAATHLTPEERAEALAGLTLDGVSVEDLCLEFTLPGYPHVELVPGGKDKVVTLENLGEYVEGVVQMTLVEGVRAQMEAFKEGFSSVVGLESLRLFDAVELDQLLCGASTSSSSWSAEELSDAILADHGYGRDSRAIQWLVQVLSSFDRHQQRDFVAFLTGSPNLPVGGFKNLKPHLTVVRKDTEAGVPADHVLPSVMTCQNYLKLPDYSSKEVMRAKLVLAMSEGQASFHLS